MKLLLFDIDGTLTNTNAVDTDCFVQAIQTVLGLPEIETDWDQYLHVSDSGLAAEICQRGLGRGPTATELEAFERELARLLWAEPAQRFTALPGAKAFLAEAASKPDVRVALATGAWRSSAQCKLQRAGMDISTLPLASASDHVERTEIMQLARAQALEAQQVGGDASDALCFYFGDGMWDLRASTKLDWNFIAIGERHAALSAAGAELACPDFSQPDEIWNWIEGCGS